MGLPSPMSSRRGTLLASGTTVALIAALLVTAPPALAVDDVPPLPTTVSTDALPAPQINGVVWDQEIVGNTVYVAGEFTTARPAGAAAGTSTVARTHLLSYNLTTGALLPWAPQVNAQVRQLAVAPGGARVYAVGDFTSVNGVTKNRIAAFSTASGALDSGFTTSANNRIHAIAVTASTVYLGGHFSSISGQTRVAAAAVSAATGAVTAWQPALANGRAYALTISPDESKVVIGGDFTTLNGSGNPGYGLGAVDAVSGATLPWAANGLIRNAGIEAAIFSLDSDADSVYGTGYVFGSGGNLEGTFRASWADGAINWVQDCHGDTYSVSASDDVIYTAGHAHYCGNIDGFPQTDPWTFYRGIAFSKDATGVATRDPYGYHNFAGNPSPTLLNWFPNMNLGSYTGQYQGPWSVDTNADYVVYGGEFTTVNGRAQQGLVRFATRDIAPNLDGPRLTGDNLVPTLQSAEPGTMTVSWPANHDRDDSTLTYYVYRDGRTGTPVHTTTVDSTFWDRPTISWIDTGLVPGQTYSYRVRAVDPAGNSGWGSTVSATVATEGTLSDYARAVIADQPTDYWRLGDTGGTTANDSVGRHPATKGGGVTLGSDGAIIGDPDTAASFSGANDSSLVASTGRVSSDNSFSVETWVKTTATGGGKIVGFGSSNTGNSSNYDRHVYMNAAGNLLFGVHPGSSKVVQSPKRYNDGEWHHIVATLDDDGMQLYVDGLRVGYDPSTTSGQTYWGYWRIGGDNTWTGNRYLPGTIDETAIYPAALTQSQILEHYTLSGRTANIPVAPSDDYGAAVFEADPLLYYRLGEATGTVAADSGSQDNDGTYTGGVSLGSEGAVRGTTDTAAAFTNGVVSSNTAVSNPSTYSTEVWFSTTTERGGKLTGFGNRASGLSNNYDRHVYMQDDGRLVFGTYTGVTNVITSADAYNDGEWHHAVATQSAAGMRLYIDGELVGTHTQASAENYTGYWRAGGDTTWGSSDAYFNGTLDEFAVYPVALTATQVAGHYELGAPEVANEAPTASFTIDVDGLAIELDASASLDPDGTIASYEWDFGDGAPVETATTASTDHTYAAAGTYTVTLTVLDDRGATHSRSHDVEVVRVNAAPVASFEHAASQLSVSFDASGSSDDSTITSYAWDFGDGTTGTGVTAGHDYAVPGDYTVTLTVTDDEGLTGTASTTVTATAPPAVDVLASDDFARTATNGWGTAPTGGSWSVSRAASSSVGGGTGLFSHTAGATRTATLDGVSATDVDMIADVSFDKALTGGGAYAGIVVRHVGSDYYQARVRFMAGGSMAVQILQGGSTVIANAALPGTYTPGTAVTIRAQASGTAPTTIVAKAWPAGTAEPSDWAVSTTSTAAALQAAGTLGVVSYASGSLSNAPLIAGYDNLVAYAGTAPVDPVDPPIDPPVDPEDPPVDPEDPPVDPEDPPVDPEDPPVDPEDPPVDPATPFATDDFERATTAGWGTATTGGAWNSAANGSYLVDAGSGAFVHAPGSTRRAILGDVSVLDVEQQVTVTVDKAAEAGHIVAGLTSRHAGAEFLQGRVRLLPGGAVAVQVMRGSATLLGNATVPGLTTTPGSTLVLKVRTTGASPTTVQVKAWALGAPEPAEWHLSATDATPALQVAGAVGVESYLSGSAPNAPVTVRYDDYIARLPQ